ncbi:hypothetical protein HXX76_012393 [Chlamydomonas incerta]|uniref:Uncharacterized protein n=1 Tax=Chlamydomonas incerta TaxID=51695 RepID=A0A835SLZ4_CHLIN|nr:hypothetical protein HXX76_012393 [Chlamydomonas incerta]|eukprot:KAG2427457.1 hypothetical protein HXX76_012393 [Chlamydomonas incerta]
MKAFLAPAVFLVGGSACLAGAVLIHGSSPSWPALAITGLLAVIGALLAGARSFWHLSLQHANGMPLDGLAPPQAQQAATPTPTPENAPGAAARWSAAAQLLSGSSREGRAAARARAARAAAAGAGAGDIESCGGGKYLLPVHSLHFDASSLYGKLYGNTLAAAPGGGGEAALVCGVQTPRGAAATAAAAAATKGGCFGADDAAAAAACPMCGHEAAGGDLCGFDDGCSVCGYSGSGSCTTTPATTGPNSRVDSSATVPTGPAAAVPASDSAGAASCSSRTGAPVSAARLVVIVQPHTILMGLQPRLQPAPGSSCGASSAGNGSSSSPSGNGGSGSSSAAVALGVAASGPDAAAAPGRAPHTLPAPGAAQLAE